MNKTESRKDEHVKITLEKDVAAEHNYWDDVQLKHNALPEINKSEVDLSTKLFGKKLILNPEAFQMMKKLLGKVNRKVSEVNKKQAVLPGGCTVIPNPAGTACGFLIKEGGKHFVFFPGVPGEVRAMSDSFTLPLRYMDRVV